MHERSDQLADLMRAASQGDSLAYRRLLLALAPRLRAMARRGLARAGRSDADCEDIVQETLLAVHLKRHTWDETQPLMPWIAAIAHYKLVDTLRRRGFHNHVPLDVCEELADDRQPDAAAVKTDVGDLLSRLPARQRQIVDMTIEGRTAREIGNALGMADGTVRVALHRALKALAAVVREDSA